LSQAIEEFIDMVYNVNHKMGSSLLLTYSLQD